ncbi:MAG: cell division protein ZapB [Fibrobacter sp.]|nr:cell division protein ZapB [Fibrobacter sp.]
MSVEFLNELENKVSALITTLDSVRQENARLKQEVEESGSMAQEIESENTRLKKELEALRADSQSNQDKMNMAAERIQGLLSRLDTAVQQ